MSTFMYVNMIYVLNIVLLTLYKAKIKHVIKCHKLPQNKTVQLVYKDQLVHDV